MTKYVHYNTPTEILQQIDTIIDERKESMLHGEPIDLEILKQLFDFDGFFIRSKYSAADVISAEDVEFRTNINKAELFITAYDMKFKLRIKGAKRRRSVELLLMWYVLATSTILTVDSLSRLLAEIDDHRFVRNMRIFMMDLNEYKKYFIRVTLLNKNLTDDVRLWLELQ